MLKRSIKMKNLLVFLCCFSATPLALGAVISIDNFPVAESSEVTLLSDVTGAPLETGVAAIGFFTRSTFSPDDIRVNFSIVGEQSFQSGFQPAGFVSTTIDLGPISPAQAELQYFLVFGESTTIGSSTSFLVLSSGLDLVADADSPIPSSASLRLGQVLEEETLHLGTLTAITPEAFGPIVATSSLSLPPLTPSSFIPIIVPEPSAAILVVMAMCGIVIRRSRN